MPIQNNGKISHQKRVNSQIMSCGTGFMGKILIFALYWPPPQRLDAA